MHPGNTGHIIMTWEEAKRHRDTLGTLAWKGLYPGAANQASHIESHVHMMRHVMWPTVPHLCHWLPVQGHHCSRFPDYTQQLRGQSSVKLAVCSIINIKGVAILNSQDRSWDRNVQQNDTYWQNDTNDPYKMSTAFLIGMGSRVCHDIVLVCIFLYPYTHSTAALNCPTRTRGKQGK